MDDTQLPYINGLGQVEFPYLLTEKSQAMKKVMNIESSYTQRVLSANLSLPDINKPRPIAGEELDKGYDSNKERLKPKFIRFNDAFKYIQPLPTHSRSTKSLADGIMRGGLGSNWKDQLNSDIPKSDIKYELLNRKSKNLIPLKSPPIPENLKIKIDEALNQLKSSKYITDEPTEEEIKIKQDYEKAIESLSKSYLYIIVIIIFYRRNYHRR